MNAHVPRGTKILAAVFILTAAGIALFWIHWFASGAYATEGDECFRVFENTFPLPDGILGLGLLASAVGLLWRKAWGVMGGLMAAGMLWYLASLDTLYNLQHDGFTDFGNPETYVKLFISAYCYGLGAVALVWLWSSERGLLRTGAKTGPMPAARVVLVVLLAATALGVVSFWTWWYTAGRAAFAHAACTRVYHDAFPLAELVLFLTSALAFLGAVRGRRWGLLWGFVTAGGLGFSVLIYAAFVVVYPGWSLVSGGMAVVVIVAGGLVVAGLKSTAWVLRGWFLRSRDAPPPNGTNASARYSAYTLALRNS